MEHHAPAGEVELLTAREFARLLRVHRSTAVEWANAGKVRSARTPGGQLRIPRSEVHRLLADISAAPPGESSPDAAA